MGDLVQFAKDLDDSLANLPTLAIAKGGEIVYTELFKGYFKRLYADFRKAKQDGKIPEDYEQTEHGKSIFQEAISGLWESRDQAKAEFIQKLFLGMAQNPVEDSLAQLAQLQIMRLAAEMTTWEVALCNALERYSTLKFDPEWQARYDSADSDVKGQVAESACKLQPEFSAWLKTDFTGNEEAIHSFLITAYSSMQSKSLLRVPVQDRSKVTGWSVCQKRGAFSEFGWKLAQYLYSAEVP